MIRKKKLFIVICHYISFFLFIQNPAALYFDNNLYLCCSDTLGDSCSHKLYVRSYKRHYSKEKQQHSVTVKKFICCTAPKHIEIYHCCASVGLPKYEFLERVLIVKTQTQEDISALCNIALCFGTWSLWEMRQNLSSEPRNLYKGV